MQKKDLTKLLRSVDDETIETISKKYPGLTDAEHDRLFRQIEHRLERKSLPEAAEQEKMCVVVQESRFAWIRHTAAAAACILVIGGTFAGLTVLQSRMPVQEQLQSADSIREEHPSAYAVGERYAAANLTQSGTLWLTVDHAEPVMQADGNLYRVCLTLESDHAVSIAGSDKTKKYKFMADNFMAAIGGNGINWTAIQPSYVSAAGMADDNPNVFTLCPGDTMELELWFRFEEVPSEWELVTSYSTAYSYTVIRS